jgi:hypothetical protein
MLVLIAQWFVASFLGLMVLGSIVEAVEKQSAGADATAYWAAIAATAAVAILLSPPVFFRLPAKAKKASYALLPVAFVALVWTSTIVEDAYSRTPKGVQEAKAEAAASAAQLERERQQEEQQASLAKAEEHERYVADAHHQVEKCMNWQGQIPALVRLVKDSLHNPHSFEHVQTEVRTDRHSNTVVVMEYRAQNGYGAVRTAAETASISPDDCSVLDSKDYDPSDFE